MWIRCLEVSDIAYPRSFHKKFVLNLGEATLPQDAQVPKKNTSAIFCMRRDVGE